MLSVKMTCNVAENGVVTLQIPRPIAPGWHEMVLIIDEHEETPPVSQADDLMQFAGVWRNADIDAVTYQRQSREEWA